MNFVRRSMAATMLIGAGLAGTTGAAFADEGHDGGTEQTGLANVSDVSTIIPTNVCGNDVPVNVLGVQVPVQDVAGNIPVLSSAGEHSTQEGSVNKDCSNAVEADN